MWSSFLRNTIKRNLQVETCVEHNLRKMKLPLTSAHGSQQSSSRYDFPTNVSSTSKRRFQRTTQCFRASKTQKKKHILCLCELLVDCILDRSRGGVYIYWTKRGGVFFFVKKYLSDPIVQSRSKNQSSNLFRNRSSNPFQIEHTVGIKTALSSAHSRGLDSSGRITVVSQVRVCSWESRCIHPCGQKVVRRGFGRVSGTCILVLGFHCWHGVRNLFF